MKNALQLFSIVPTKKTGTGKKSGVGLLKLLAETQISAFTGAFLMLFMVTVVSAAAFSMNEEIASYSEAAGLPKQTRGSVLGVAAYGYQSPTCANNVCLRYELVGSNGDGYAANIFYFPQTGSRMNGSIKVNRNRFAYNIRQAGMTATGYNLDEGETYKFDFYSGSRGGGKILHSLSLTMPGDSGDQNNCSQLIDIPTNCSIDYSKDSCGQLVCYASDPLPPTYGYRAVNVGPVAQGYFKEGWIDRISQVTSQEPGDVKIMGWFFDNTNTGGVKGASIDIALRNSATGQEYKMTDWNIDAGTLGQRPDAQNYIAQRIGSSNPSGLEVMRFTARVQNLPFGNYYIYNAKYNGNLFNIHSGNAYQPIIVTPKVPSVPSYGYAGYMEKLTVSSDKKSASVTGWAYQNAQLLNINVLLINAQTQTTYAATNIEQQPLSVRPDVVEKLKAMGINNPGIYKGFFVANFNNLPTGTYTVYYGSYNNYVLTSLVSGTPISIDLGNTTSKISVAASGAVGSGINNFSPGQKSVEILSFDLVSSGSVDLSKFMIISSRLVKNLRAYQNGVDVTYSTTDTGFNGDNIISLSPAAKLVGGTKQNYKIFADIISDGVGSFSAVLNNVVYVTSNNEVVIVGLPVYSGTMSVAWPTNNVAIRVGSVINKNGTIYLVGSSGLYGFPSMTEFSSWGFGYGDIVTANSAENQLVQIGVVPVKQPGCVKPLDQISGKCSNTVLNAPTMSLGPSGSIVAGVSQQYNFLSAGAISPKLEFAINWGDGTVYTNQTGQIGSAGSSVGATHVFANPGTYTITVTVIDIGGGSKTSTFTQVVTSATSQTNKAPEVPTMSLGPSGSIVAGVSQQYNFLSSDAENDNVTFSINWGDGSNFTNLNGQRNGSSVIVGEIHTYANPGTYTITVTVNDLKGGTNSKTFQQVVTSPVATSVNTTNWAAAANGGKASASSEFSSSALNLTFPARGVIDGEKTGATWGSGGGWNDATSGAYPDWVQVEFSGAKNISKINIYTLADNYPASPTTSTSAKLYGIVDFQVQYDNGSGWQIVPNGVISGNNVVLREITFPTINNVTKIRVLVNKAGTSIGDFSRIVELEAF